MSRLRVCLRVISKKESRVSTRKQVSLVLLAAAIGGGLAGCGSKADDANSPPAQKVEGPTKSEMPPEVKRQMEKQQSEMKARAEAQGKAMQGNTR